MILNSFVFSEHQCRDFDHEEAIQLSLDLRTAFIKFKQVKRIMQTQKLNIDLKIYYNLIRFTNKKTSHEQLNLALKILKLKDFRVRCLKKYVVKNEVRKHQVIEHFFFCNTNQIRYVRRFVFEFVIQTDVTFNINYLNMSLSVLIEIINIFKIFAVTYCFVISESIEVFFFINVCVQNLIFHDDFLESSVMLEDFSTELSSTMTQRLDMKSELDVIDSEIKLQLCF